MSSDAVSRASSRLLVCAGPDCPITTSTAPVRIPAMTITTSTSTRVNPRAMRGAGLVAPVANFGIDAIAARLAVGPVGPDIDVAVDAGIEVKIIAAPWIFGQAFDIPAGL